MSRRRDERLVVALATITCGIAALTYLSHIPRQSGVGPQAAAALAQAGAPAQGRTAIAAARPATGSAVPAPEVHLSVTLWPHGPQGARRAWAIECPPASPACRAAIGRLRALATDPPGPCAAVRPRDAEAIITGYVSGKYVTAWLDQRDGCGAKRWRTLRPLLTPPKDRPAAPKPAVRTG